MGYNGMGEECWQKQYFSFMKAIIDEAFAKNRIYAIKVNKVYDEAIQRIKSLGFNIAIYDSFKDEKIVRISWEAKSIQDGIDKSVETILKNNETPKEDKYEGFQIKNDSFASPKFKYDPPIKLQFFDLDVMSNPIKFDASNVDFLGTLRKQMTYDLRNSNTIESLTRIEKNGVACNMPDVAINANRIHDEDIAKLRAQGYSISERDSNGWVIMKCRTNINELKEIFRKAKPNQYIRYLYVNKIDIPIDRFLRICAAKGNSGCQITDCEFIKKQLVSREIPYVNHKTGVVIDWS